MIRKKTAAKTAVRSSLWQDAPTELTRRSVFLLAYGDTNSGRSTFALTAPGPIAYLHSAEKIEGIIQPFAREKEIRVYDFGGTVPPNASVKETSRIADETWQNVKAAWVDAYGWARTIVIDTETDLWELIRLAYFGDIKPSGGRLELNWGPVNSDWKAMFRSFKGQDGTNLIVISQTEDEYKESKKGFGTKTGNTVRKGQKSIPFMADVIVRTESDMMTQEFTSTIEKPWYGMHAMGLELEGEMSNFGQVMSMISGLEPKEWE